MPIYEYQCTECGHTLEKLQKLDAEPLRDCPACGKPTLQKLISAAGFRLKGGGWYETDFKTGNKKNVSDGSSAGKADSKPASKSDSTNSKQSTSSSSSSGTGKSAASKSNGSKSNGPK